MTRRTLLPLLFFVSLVWRLEAQTSASEIYPLSDLRAGQRGEVWTVFQGTRPEPFSVEVTGVIKNALGPGKSIILCRLTDPRVQDMGAVAGMSGSPLYIDGRFAGALSYQLQRFETIHYAGFTPAADMAEVADRIPTAVSGELPASPEPAAPPPSGTDSGFRPMRPVFALGGLAPRASALVTPQLEALGIDVVALGGSSQAPAAGSAPAPTLAAGDAVSVALTTGDITLAGTGTVSRVDGSRVVAFGHPMLSLGDVQFPMCSAEVVAILPSNLESVKLANVGPVIGCISQDRLSAVSGTLGPGPEMTEVEVVADQGGSHRTLHFQVVRDRQVAPIMMLGGVADAVLGSNDSDPSEGFRVRTTVSFSPTQQISRESVYAGEQGFTQGMFEFLASLTAELQNPFEKALPRHVSFHVESLAANPAVMMERFDISRTTVRPGDTFQVTLAWRNYQGSEEEATVDVPVDASWAGKTLEVIAAPGRALDELTGHSHLFRPGQLRSFDSYLGGMRDNRPEDGLCIAVCEKSSLFYDQAVATPDLPASFERIAAASDPARYQKRSAYLPLWETHILSGKVAFTESHRILRVLE